MNEKKARSTIIFLYKFFPGFVSCILSPGHLYPSALLFLAFLLVDTHLVFPDLVSGCALSALDLLSFPSVFRSRRIPNGCDAVVSLSSVNTISTF